MNNIYVECFLHFLLTLNIWDDEEILFSSFDEFIISELGYLPHLVISFPKIKRDFTNNQIRVIWNKDLYDGILTSYEFNKVIRDIKFFNSKEKKWNIFNNNKLNYYYFHYGYKDNQEFWGIMPSLGINDDWKELLNFAAPILKNNFNQIQQANKIKEFGSLAYLDDITGLYNHRKLSQDISNTIMKFNVLNEGLAILFVDIDHFKEVNDSFGHIVGTKLLKDFASLLRILIRESDYIYRYGGDEFVIILSNTSNVNIEEIGRRVLRGIKSNLFYIEDNKTYSLSASIGIARFPEDAKTGQEIINLADQMMYNAKKSGRGKVCLAGNYFD